MSLPNSRYGPEDRHLFEDVAAQVYRDAVDSGSLAGEDPQLAEGGKYRPAVELLLDLGLLRWDEEAFRYYPVDPAMVQSQVVVPLGREGAVLLTESARWAEAFSDLGHAYRASPRVSVSPTTEIHGLSNIDKFLTSAIADCTEELLTAQPYGRRPPEALAVAEDRDVKALERGASMRTLYQHSARFSAPTRDYVADISARGAEVRTLDEFFKRLIVVDRKVAVIPASEDHHVALAIHEPSLIAYLVDIFDRAWERAHPFDLSQGADRAVAADVRAMTIRLLKEGHSDPTSAKRLGVSSRTYAGYISSLKEEYGVDTRFQLGFAMGREAGLLAGSGEDVPGTADETA